MRYHSGQYTFLPDLVFVVDQSATELKMESKKTGLTIAKELARLKGRLKEIGNELVAAEHKLVAEKLKQVNAKKKLDAAALHSLVSIEYKHNLVLFNSAVFIYQFYCVS